MIITHDGREAGISRPSKNYLRTGRIEITIISAVRAKNNCRNLPPRRCDRWGCCAPAIAAHLVAPGGAQEHLCRRHWLAARDGERVEIARRRLDLLFGGARPWRSHSGGVVGSRAAMQARIGAEGRAV